MAHNNHKTHSTEWDCISRQQWLAINQQVNHHAG